MRIQDTPGEVVHEIQQRMRRLNELAETLAPSNTARVDYMLKLMAMQVSALRELEEMAQDERRP